MAQDRQFPEIVPVHPGEAHPAPPEPLPESEIRLIHNGLMAPSAQAIRNMDREILKSRGVENPDLI